MAQSPQCGFIGLGIMGGRMATRLATAGVALTVWNRSSAKTAVLEAHGARAATSAADLAHSANIICLCLSDAAAVEAVVFGPQGLVEGLTHGGLIVDFSSIAPGSTRAFAQRLHDGYGATWLDAPVTGGPLAAERGTLAILCGGETADVARVEFLLAHVASKFTHFGSVGAGQAAKLCNQILAGSAMLACVESIALAERLGLDPKLFSVAIEAGFASSPLTRLLLPRIAARTFDPPVGTTAMMLKDLSNVLESAGEVGADLPLTEAAAQVYARAVEMHLASREPSALIECYPPGNRRSSSM